MITVVIILSLSLFALLPKPSFGFFSFQAPKQMRLSASRMKNIETESVVREGCHVVETSVISSRDGSIRDLTQPTLVDINIRGDYSPMERVILTANGNLQRIVSAYYNLPVTVVVQDSSKIGEHLYRRLTSICVGGQEICKVSGEIHTFSNRSEELIESGAIGIGQLFKSLGVQPTFRLIEVGRKPFDFSRESKPDQKCLYRKYELSCEEFKCEFSELFSPQLFNI